MSFEQRSDAGYMIGLTGTLLRRTPWLALAAVIVLAAIEFAADSYPQFRNLIGLPRLIASLAFQYQITFTLLEQSGLAERGERARIWALLGLSIVMEVAILIGLVLLVIPGIYLLLRWTVAVPVLVAKRAGVFEALKRSGEEMEGRYWPVLGVCLVFGSTLLLGAGAMVALGPHASPPSSIATDILLSAGLVGYWYAAVAVYIAGRPYGKVAEVFA
jgi:hypothetical protein